MTPQAIESASQALQAAAHYVPPALYLFAYLLWAFQEGLVAPTTSRSLGTFLARTLLPYLLSSASIMFSWALLVQVIARAPDVTPTQVALIPIWNVLLIFVFMPQVLLLTAFLVGILGLRRARGSDLPPSSYVFVSGLVVALVAAHPFVFEGANRADF